MASIKDLYNRAVSFVKRYWKPLVGVAVAAAGVVLFYLFRRGIGGLGIGANGVAQQLRDNNDAIVDGKRQLADNSQQLVDNKQQLADNRKAVDSGARQLDVNKSAIEKLDAAIAALRRVKSSGAR